MLLLFSPRSSSSYKTEEPTLARGVSVVFEQLTKSKNDICHLLKYYFITFENKRAILDITPISILHRKVIEKILLFLHYNLFDSCFVL